MTVTVTHEDGKVLWQLKLRREKELLVTREVYDGPPSDRDSVRVRRKRWKSIPDELPACVKKSFVTELSKTKLSVLA
jgi:hypothetical protein